MTDEIDERVAALRVAATGGDTAAAREVGRLLCLLPADPDHADGQNIDDVRYPGVPWLRQALDADPADATAALLLATRLHQRYDQALATGGEDEEPLRDEAMAFYRRVLDADPANAGAALGWSTLDQDLRDDHSEHDAVQREPAYCYYLLNDGQASGSVFYDESIVVTDPAELRWACENWLDLAHVDDEALTGFAIVVMRGESEHATVDVDVTDEHRPDWTGLRIPPLPGPALPPGQPARTSTGTGTLNHYGYTLLYG